MTPRQASANWALVGLICLVSMYVHGHELTNVFFYLTVLWCLVSLPLINLRLRYERRGY